MGLGIWMCVGGESCFLCYLVVTFVVLFVTLEVLVGVVVVLSGSWCVVWWGCCVGICIMLGWGVWVVVVVCGVGIVSKNVLVGVVL